ncbi:hypothetical protein RCL_jg17637.t1 [Rhizophagus clarus]|uniref:Uncharacterized protein n=1 Tax=Rhizophagus clarus TaxID=94130 RepID=A0A8H3QIB4_9GLOM|nr:hypothetical protein RCL_jg17637.t1 [Rhizophagus clarus]
MMTRKSIHEGNMFDKLIQLEQKLLILINETEKITIEHRSIKGAFSKYKMIIKGIQEFNNQNYEIGFKVSFL